MNSPRFVNGKWGKGLQVGDTIKVWWSSRTLVPNQDRIVEMRHPSAAEKTWPSYARMMKVFPNGYAFATFLSGYQMTIDLGDWYEMP